MFSGVARSTGYQALEEFISSLKISTQTEPEVVPGSWCAEDYKRDCPDGWHATPAGCQSADTQQCGGSFPFAGASVAQKINFANDCQAPWPCASSCSKDYSRCPRGWTDAGSGVCSGSAGTAEGCQDTYNFVDISVAEKRQLSLACGIQWDCLDASNTETSRNADATPLQAGL